MAIKTEDVAISAGVFKEFFMPKGAVSLLIRNSVDMDVADSDGGNTFPLLADESLEFKNNFHEGGIAELKEGESIFVKTVANFKMKTLTTGAG